MNVNADLTANAIDNADGNRLSLKRDSCIIRQLDGQDSIPQSKDRAARRLD